MTLQERLAEDLKQAMRAGDVRRRETIRMARAAVKNAEIAKRGPLTEDEVLAVLAKEVRQRKESIEEFRKGNRPDLVAKEEEELRTLEPYLPQQMSREEIREAAQSIIAAVGAQGPADIGKVMPRLMAELKGRADGREINAVVSELLGKK